MRMRTMLLIPLLFIPILFTSASLLVLRRHMQQQMREAFARDLQHSAATYKNLENERRTMLAREAALLSAQPSLKALMTTQDSRTIQDQGGEYAKLSDADLLALISPSGEVVALYQQNPGAAGGQRAIETDAIETGRMDSPAPSRTRIIKLLRKHPASSYIFDGQRLFEVATQPLYFGSRETGALLGYVVIGSIVDQQVAHQVSQAAAAEIAFFVGSKVISSTFEQQGQLALQANLPVLEGSSAPGVILGPEGKQYLADHIALANDGAEPVGLIVLRSMEELRLTQLLLNRIVIGLGLTAFLLGGLLAFYIARRLTSPLEGLAGAVAEIGGGNYQVQLPSSGAAEVRHLSASIEAMRRKIRATQAELLEAERLATIGEMASSISHDLRHYLASVYANAEFLASTRLTDEERVDLLGEIQLSVQGTTDLIDSLLLFTQTGRALQLSYESVTSLVERAITMVSKHPEAIEVSVTVQAAGAAEAWVDAKKIERAIYNLVLNGCQAAKRSIGPAVVEVELIEQDNTVYIRVSDSGQGVPEAIRSSLFEPFVSAEKQNGIGIGLTLASTIAEEHGGSVQLEISQPGKTVFVFALRRHRPQTSASKAGTVHSTQHPLRGSEL